ncbi:MAG: glutamine--tRNA ligase, partial [Acutalibacteraceae bacterium]|nr:glutamine--tRNA ligase [Acutalibacteraceae bacterium]
NLFTVPDPDTGDRNFLDYINPESLKVLKNCKTEKAVADLLPPASFQFMRLGYFCLDNKDSKPGAPVFNRSVSLKGSYKP